MTYSRTFYFADKGVQRGVAFEFGKVFEDWLNKKLSTGSAKVNVAMMPMPRDALGRALLDGKVDLVIAQVTVRPELQGLVDFTNATRTNVSEVVVTGPGGPAISSVDDLSGKPVYTRKGSNFHASLVSLNERLKAKGKPPVIIEEAPGNLEDDDLLEMVDAGLIPTIVVHDYMASFWKKVFTNLNVHDTVTLRTDASVAVPIRKNSPQLMPALNEFISEFGLGTAFGNMMEKRYFASTTFVKNAGSEAERKKLLTLVELFMWFGNVEQIASERIGRETVTYVSNIYKYYVAYRLIAEERARRDAAKAAVASGGK